METAPIHPSRAYYALAAAILVGGVALCIRTVRKGPGIASNLQQVAAPGRSEFTFSLPGVYTIFYERESIFNKRVYSTGEDFPGIECTLVSKSTGAPIGLSPPSTQITYWVPGRAGKSVFDFQINRAGVYELTTAYAKGRAGPEIVLAVGQAMTKETLETVFSGLAFLFGSFLLTAAIVTITLVKRHNAAKRLKTAGGPPPPIE